MEPINYNKTEENNNTGLKVSKYSLLKAEYNKFMKQMKKSDFKNSYTRYLSERSILTGMLEYANTEHFNDETDKIISRLKEVDKELDNRGIKLPCDYK